MLLPDDELFPFDEELPLDELFPPDEECPLDVLRPVLDSSEPDAERCEDSVLLSVVVLAT